MNPIIYVSPSVIPSTSANSIHVLHQSIALCKKCSEMHLVFGAFNKSITRDDIEEFYGITLPENLILKPVYLKSEKAIQVALSIAVFKTFGFSLYSKSIISRNLYFSFVASVFVIKHLYESHGIEPKFKALLQRYIITRQQKAVVISNSLKKILESKFGLTHQNLYVLHDACNLVNSANSVHKNKPNKNLQVGYFGHLYEGRGIEVVIYLAEKNSDINFKIAGGTAELVQENRERNSLKNLEFLGYMQNSQARTMMSEMDILLMPYQKRVSIGPKDSDTASWMSPLKMFEYMAARTPIISSDLPVLREVLSHGDNSLLVEPDNLEEWHHALQQLVSNKDERLRLAEAAYGELESKYTWDIRAQKLCKILEKK